jgi:hypothetical protein
VILRCSFLNQLKPVNFHHLTQSYQLKIILLKNFEIKMKKLNRVFFGTCLVIVSIVNIVVAGENNTKRSGKAQEAVKIKVSSWGPAQSDVQAAMLRVEKSRAVHNVLKNTKYRLISFDYIESGNEKFKSAQPPKDFKIIFYDYTNDRTFVAEGDFARTKIVTVREENFQPGVSNQELLEAFQLIKNDPELGELYKQNQLKIFEAMPPVSIQNGERLVNVGIKIGGENQIVGISFKNNRIVRYKGNAPLTSQATHDDCGINSANQGNTPNGTAGQYQLTISQNNSPLWEMLVIRPSASSGNSEERSGIEVRDVKYKGKSVLKRGHAPILNVQYEADACGPYRDWQYAEGFFNAPAEGASDPAPGIRILAAGQSAKTSLDSGIDSGNFAGVAVYTQNNETILVSEMDAGWYRYMSEWRFANDGTIRPRYGFGATTNSCVCNEHNHNIYWRFDFDIVNSTNKIFQIERGRKFMKPVTSETTRLRNYQTNRSFLIQNSSGEEAYLLVPSLSDGKTNDFGAGDFWFLKYQAGTNGEPDEIDDPNGEELKANFAPWLNNESLLNQDVVVWYAGHYGHNSDGESLLNPDHSGTVLTGSHVIGPTLRPVRW